LLRSIEIILLPNSKLRRLEERLKPQLPLLKSLREKKVKKEKPRKEAVTLKKKRKRKRRPLFKVVSQLVMLNLLTSLSNQSLMSKITTQTTNK